MRKQRIQRLLLCFRALELHDGPTHLHGVSDRSLVYGALHQWMNVASEAHDLLIIGGLRYPIGRFDLRTCSGAEDRCEQEDYECTRKEVRRSH